MVAVRATEVDATLKNLSPSRPVVLLYGPDAGLVSERARQAAQEAVADPTDPFQLVRLDGDLLAAHPSRLAEEVETIGLFAAQRAIWVKPSSRSLAPAVEPVLQKDIVGTRVVIEAGDLGKSAPLRTLCERSPRALALPCYSDDSRDIDRLIDETLKTAGLTIEPDAREMLAASLGSNRLATRGELAKLIVYSQRSPTITPDHVAAVVSDVSSSALDSAIDAAFGGNAAVLDASLRRLASEGASPSAFLSAALRHTLALLDGRTALDAGRSAASVVETWRGLHFRRKPLVQAQLNRWTSDAIRKLIQDLQETSLSTRRHPDLGMTAVSALLLAISRRASGQR